MHVYNYFQVVDYFLNSHNETVKNTRDSLIHLLKLKILKEKDNAFYSKSLEVLLRMALQIIFSNTSFQNHF